MNYKIIYSKRRTLALQISRELEVIVRAPKGASTDRIEKFVRLHEGWINEHLEMQKSRLERYPEPSEAELLELERRAWELLPERASYFSALMGVKASHISINRARSRFGSCSDKGRINFSCRLMRYPIEAIDYVVVHELAHLRHLNHSREFWAFVESFLPDYKQRKRLLK
ncbi:MAG: M48 family metallopeptidase [Clostridia bacterium]|nr:M48 family metallopeptidase [Clostridia bacterium]